MSKRRKDLRDEFAKIILKGKIVNNPHDMSVTELIRLAYETANFALRVRCLGQPQPADANQPRMSLQELRGLLTGVSSTSCSIWLAPWIEEESHRHGFESWQQAYEELCK